MAWCNANATQCPGRCADGRRGSYVVLDSSRAHGRRRRDPGLRCCATIAASSPSRAMDLIGWRTSTPSSAPATDPLPAVEIQTAAAFNLVWCGQIVPSFALAPLHHSCSSSTSTGTHLAETQLWQREVKAPRRRWR